MRFAFRCDGPLFRVFILRYLSYTYLLLVVTSTGTIDGYRPQDNPAVFFMCAGLCIRVVGQ